jgi:hypothetical protein
VVARNLAEEEVLRLDRGGAFVQRVDLGIADVLLDRVVLQKSGAAERLQGFRQALVGPLRTRLPSRSAAEDR